VGRCVNRLGASRGGRGEQNHKRVICVFHFLSVSWFESFAAQRARGGDTVAHAKARNACSGEGVATEPGRRADYVPSKRNRAARLAVHNFPVVSRLRPRTGWKRFRPCASVSREVRTFSARLPGV